MNQQNDTGKARVRKLAIAAAVLAVIAVVVNLENIADIATGRRSLKAVVYGQPDEYQTDISGWEMPPDMGKKNAKVTIELFVAAGDPCHVHTVSLGHALGTIDPQRIFVDFCNTRAEAAHQRSEELKVGCEQGIAVNGETKFEVPAPDAEGSERKKTLYLTADGKWTPKDLYYILDDKLKDKYHGNGLPMGPHRFKAVVEERTEKYYKKLEKPSNRPAKPPKTTNRHYPV